MDHSGDDFEKQFKKAGAGITLAEKMSDDLAADMTIVGSFTWDFSVLTQDQCYDLCSYSLFNPLIQILPQKGARLCATLSDKARFGKLTGEMDEVLKNAGRTIAEAYDIAESTGMDTSGLFEFIANIQGYIDSHGIKGLGHGMSTFRKPPQPGGP